MTDTDLSKTRTPAVRGFAAAVAAFRTGEDTPRAYLERCLEAVEAWEPRIGAFVATNFEGAREAADRSTARWKAGAPLSALDGMPVGIKDIMETADMPTEQGSPLFSGWRGGRDCAAVAALREAGAVIVGKTVTTEFAATEPRGTCNPWDVARTPGGSSSGSAAAVGAGLVPAALGTQVIGSILRPASFCGVYGYKPSIGGINRGGSFDGFSQSCTGVLAATLDDTWITARTVAARAGGDAGFPGISGPLDPPPAKMPRRLAFLRTAGWGTASEEAVAALQQALDRLKAAGVEIVDQDSHEAAAAAEAAIADAVAISRAINAWESRWPLNTYARDMDRTRLSAGMLERLEAAEKMDQEEYAGLLERRRRVRETYARLAADCDACITLAASGPAPIGLKSTGNPAFAIPSSLLGTPALTMPLLQAEGLPLGLQMIGFADRDAALFGAAAACEEALRAEK